MKFADFSRSASPTLSVLVAEDHAAAREPLVALMRRNGYVATGVANGDDAFDLIKSDDPPRIVLLDWEMPGLDGLEVCRATRALSRRSYIYLIMLTARDSAEDALAAFAAGADDFLSKPVDALQLLARMHSGERILALEDRLANRIAELERTLHEVRHLKRLLPICMYCKRIRDDDQYWHDIETYIHEHTGTDFSHGICPECLSEVLPAERNSAEEAPAKAGEMLATES